MAEFTIEEIKEHNDNIKSQIKCLNKPLGAYQLYCQAMREMWTNLSDDDKNIYYQKAKNEKNLYEEKKENIQEKAREKIRSKKIFLCYTTNRVPCVGLDNGITNQRIVGPVNEIEVFTEAEKQKLISKGVPEESIGKYKSIGGQKFNWRAAKKWNVTVYGGCINDRAFWGVILENYKGRAGNFTHYTNYKGEKWTTEY